MLVPKFRPAGKVALISHEVIAPLPVSVAVSGKSPLAVLFVSVKFSGEYDNVGTSSTIVMLMVAEEEPPELFAQIVYVTGLVCRTVGVPQTVPLLVPKFRPAGRVSLIAHEVITPLPVSVAVSGKSPLAVLFVSVKFSGEYESVGNWSLMVMLIVAELEPPELFAQIV